MKGKYFICGDYLTLKEIFVFMERCVRCNCEGCPYIENKHCQDLLFSALIQARDDGYLILRSEV